MSVNDIFDNKHDTEVFMKGFVLGGNNTKNTIISKGEDAIKFIVENGTILCSNEIGNNMKLLIVGYSQDLFSPIDFGTVKFLGGIICGYNYGDSYKQINNNYYLPTTIINPEMMVCPNATKNILFFTVVTKGNEYMFAFSNKQGYLTVRGKEYSCLYDNYVIQEKHIGEYCPPITTCVQDIDNLTITCDTSELTSNNISISSETKRDQLEDGSYYVKEFKYIDSPDISNVSVTIKYNLIEYKPKYEYTPVYIGDRNVGDEKTLLGFVKYEKQLINTTKLHYEQYASNSGGHISLLPSTDGSSSFYVNSSLNDYKKFYMWINDYWTTLNHYFGCTDIVSPEYIIDSETMLIE